MVVIYDIETLKSVFTYTALDIKTNVKYQFVLHKDRNDWYEFINHLHQCKGQIGFNNVNFDYPIIHYILKNAYRWPSLFNVETIIKLIYQEAQRIIDSQNSDNFNEIVAIKQKEVKIPQLDLFKLWHYNNKARKRIAA